MRTVNKDMRNLTEILSERLKSKSHQSHELKRV